MDAGEIAEFDTVLNIFDKEASIFRSLCNEAGLSRQDILRIRQELQEKVAVAATGSSSRWRHHDYNSITQIHPYSRCIHISQYHHLSLAPSSAHDSWSTAVYVLMCWNPSHVTHTNLNWSDWTITNDVTGSITPFGVGQKVNIIVTLVEIMITFCELQNFIII